MNKFERVKFMKNIIKISPTSDNMTPIFNEIFKKLKNSDTETVIELEKGDYYFKRSGSEKMKFFSSGGRNCENYVLFPIENIENLTIEGNGSQFIYCDRVQPFLIKNCCNITLRNISTDYSFYRYAFAKVTSVTKTGFEAVLNKDEFNYYVKDGFLNFICGEDVLSTKKRQISMRKIEPEKSCVYFLRVGESECPLNAAASNIYVDALETENGALFNYRKENTFIPEYKEGDTIILAYDNSREAQSFYCEFSKNITFENVCIYRGGGMGFVADVCENILLDNYRIMKKEGRKEYFTTTADGIFLTNCNGNFTLKNSYISDTYDDAINVHGYYTKIEEILAPKKVKLSHLHPAHWGLIPYFKGDKVHISNPDTLNEEYILEIEEISYDDDRNNIIVSFKEEVDLNVGMLIENPDRTPDVLLENNVIKRAPHMRLSARNVLVRNNKLSLDSCDIYINDLITFWGESGAVKKFEITGNTFEKAKQGNIIADSCRFPNSNHLHEKIIIKNNVFKMKHKEAIKLSCVKEVEEKNNIFLD